MTAVRRRPRGSSTRELWPQHKRNTPETRASDAGSWTHLDHVVWQFPEHLWGVEGLDSCRRQVEAAALVQSHGIFNDQAAFRNKFIIGTKAIEGSLLEG